MRCFECRYLDRSKVLTCYPPKYYCTYDKTTHFADDECKYEHYPIVRCKDCRFRGHWDCPLLEDYICGCFDEDGYCSYGERREPTIPMFKESEEAYKAWTGEDMGKTGDLSYGKRKGGAE